MLNHPVAFMDDHDKMVVQNCGEMCAEVFGWLSMRIDFQKNNWKVINVDVIFFY
jgi:predicted molibdopterin-dependent oxidoreductase YjgC